MTPLQRIGFAVVALAASLAACHGGFVPTTATTNDTLAPYQQGKQHF